MNKNQYNISNCNTKTLNKQKEYLKEQIKEGTNNDFFKVFSLECGTGKTITTEEALADLEGKQALFVRERNADCIKSAERINKLAGKEIAIAINTDTYSSKELNKLFPNSKEKRGNKIAEYPVVIISHEKYKALAVDKEVRKYFIEDRQILIIDEFLNMAKGNELQISKAWIDTYETMLGSRTLRSLFSEIVRELEDYLLSQRKKNTFFNAKSDIDIITKRINKLKQLIKTNLNKEYCKSIGYTKNELCQKVEELKQFYIQTCVVEGDIMYCTNRAYQYWLLNNNIMLDASAKLNQAYNLSPIFEVNNNSKVLDHSKWSFFIYAINTTSSAKGRAKNFYDVINNTLEEQGTEDTLYIGNIADEKLVNATYKNHFGNVTGSNDYKDLKNVIIGHTPNVPYRLYVLEYIYFSNKKFDNRKKWDGKNTGAGDYKVYRFSNKQFEKYRQCRNANEIYQAIKRVNRNMEHETKVILLNNDSETVERVTKMFKDCNVNEYDNDFVEYEKSKMDKYNEERKENSYASKFIKLSIEIMNLKHLDLQQEKKNRKGEMVIQQGFYQKKKVIEYMKISRKHFSEYVLNNVDVIDFLQKHNIAVAGQAIDFSNAVKIV